MKYLDQTVSTGAPLLALDGTFKLNSLGYPLLIVTTQDSLHQVFPIAFAPCSSECEETVTFVLTSVVKAYKLLYNKALNVKFFISDCALYMFSSVRKVFPALKAHISCYFHVKQSQKKRGMSDRGVHKDDRKAILSHLDVIHQMVTKEHFIKYWQLFKKEYLIYDDYCKYFEDTYINSNCNLWHFFDVDANVFLTNNCCESLNSMIKRDWTNRERRPLHIFFKTLKDGIYQLANQNKPFIPEVEVTTNLQIEAAKLESKGLFVKFKDYYFIQKKHDEGKISMDQAKRFVNIKYSNLTDFKKDCLTMNVLKVNNTEKTVTCFCSSGFKSGVCVHKLALEINLKFRQKLVLLVPKRRRGRKRKAATAMNYQQDEPKRFKKQGLGNRSEPITVILKKNKSQRK